MGRGWRGRGGWEQADLPPADDRDAWFTGAPEVVVDREEITVVGTLADLEGEFDDASRAAAESGRIARWREETRDERIEIARQAEHRYGRKVAWGAVQGGTRELFTHLAV